MLALVNVERAHDRAVVSVTSTLPTCEPAEQSLAQSKSELEASEEPHHDEAAETAKLVKRKKGAMKVVADHMIQQVDTVTVNHEMRMSHFKEQLAGLDHASMDDETALIVHRVAEQIRESELAHTKKLESLEEKVRRLLVRMHHGRWASRTPQRTVEGTDTHNPPRLSTRTAPAS